MIPKTNPNTISNPNSNPIFEPLSDLNDRCDIHVGSLSKASFKRRLTGGKPSLNGRLINLCSAPPGKTLHNARKRLDFRVFSRAVAFYHPTI